MRDKLILSIGATLGCFVIGQAFAALPIGGAKFVQVKDGTNDRCINYNQDKISITVRSLITEKKKNWFSEGKSIAIMLNVLLEGDSGEFNEKFSLPRAFKASIQSYSGGLIAIPVEPNLLNNFKLKNGANTYTGADIDVTLLNIDGKTALGDVALAVIEATNSLPIPANPFTPYLNYAQKYANAIVDKVSARADEKDNQTKENLIRMQFSPTDTCVGDKERTGTKAIVKAFTGLESDGIINTDDTTVYCFKVTHIPSYTIKFSRKNNGICPEAESVYKSLNNPHIAFFINAEKIVTSSTPIPVVNSTSSMSKTEIALWNHYKSSGLSNLKSSSLATWVSRKINNADLRVGNKNFDKLLDDANASILRCSANGMSAEECLMK